MTSARKNTRRTLIVAGTLLLAVAVAAFFAYRAFGPGTGGLQNAANKLEDWIASQIVGVANSYLVPQLDYDEIDYQAPRTVDLRGVTLTAPDGTDVLALDGMTVTLAEIPRIGEPIRISTLTLDTPTIRLIRETKPDGSTGFRGLSPIAKASPADDDTVKPEFRLSNILRLEKIEIADGSFYLDTGDDSPPMTITGLTTTINSAPEADKPGWYELDIDTTLGPLLSLTLTGELNLDTFVTRISDMAFKGQLDPSSATALPAALQTLIAEHNATGDIDLTALGYLPLTDPMSGDISFQTTLTDFNLANADYQIPIASLTANGTLAEGRLSIPALSADLLQGTLNANLQATLTDTAMPASAEWRIEQVNLKDLLSVGSSAEGRLAGLLNASGSVSTTLADPKAGLQGQGEAHIRDGRVLILPGLTQLASLMNVAVRQATEPKHKADATFTLSPAGVEITSSEVTTEFLAARATGTIGFDRSINLTANAGPMEKLQSLLGEVGNLLGNLTDRLVKYRIQGTTSEPKVSVAPLGLGG